MEWSERLPRMWAIVWKDVLRARSAVLVSIIIAATIAFLVAPVAIASRGFPSTFVWFDGTLRPFYAISAALTGFTLAITFYGLHGGEVHRGTIRSIILYPVDANDIALAKLASTYVITFLVTTILFFGSAGPFFAFGLWPFADFVGIHLVALGVGFFSLATGVFLAHVLAFYAKRIVISPSGLGSLFLVGSALLTETAANGIASQIILLLARSEDRFPSPQDFEAAANFARVVSVLSPYHWGARFLSQAFRIFPSGGEALVAIPLALTILALVGGYILGKKLYLDVFTQ